MLTKSCSPWTCKCIVHTPWLIIGMRNVELQRFLQVFGPFGWSLDTAILNNAKYLSLMFCSLTSDEYI